MDFLKKRDESAVFAFNERRQTFAAVMTHWFFSSSRLFTVFFFCPGHSRKGSQILREFHIKEECLERQPGAKEVGK